MCTNKIVKYWYTYSGFLSRYWNHLFLEMRKEDASQNITFTFWDGRQGLCSVMYNESFSMANFCKVKFKKGKSYFRAIPGLDLKERDCPTFDGSIFEVICQL